MIYGRPYVDDIILVSDSGKSLARIRPYRCFNSGSILFQLHYPFENKDIFDKNFPSDFEGVDQQEVGFLLIFSTMLFDNELQKCTSNGLVLIKMEIRCQEIRYFSRSFWNFGYSWLSQMVYDVYFTTLG